MVTWLAFAIVLASEIVLVGAVVVSMIRPSLRIWPPPGKGTWQFHLTFWPVVTGVLAGIALAWLDWNTFLWKGDERIFVGAVLIGVGLGLADWGVRTLGRIASSGLGGSFQELGPYRFTRNPQYVGDILAAIGLAVVANSTLLWIATIPAVIGLILAPYAEEPWLRARFGESYVDYSARVPRFVGVRKVLKILGWVVVAVVVLVLAALSYFLIRYPRSSDPPDVTVEATPARLARGEYLFHAVAQCAACHSPDNTIGAVPYVDRAAMGQGGAAFPLGEAGVVYSRNITPAGIGSWTDGQLIRALREGVNAEGEPLFPIMPYSNYRSLSEDDLYSLVAYTRTIPAKSNQPPARELHFPMSLIIRMMPSPAEWPPPAAPDTSDHVAYGRYLVTAASCADCHSPRGERGEPLPGMDFAGGNDFGPIEGWTVRTANITPDSSTGIGRWTRDDFVQRFKSMEPYATRIKPRAADEPHSPMPWPYYGTMTEQDLGAIYDYLRSVPPVENRVAHFERLVEGATR